MQLRTKIQTAIGLGLASVALAGATMNYGSMIDSQVRIMDGTAYVRTIERGYVPMKSGDAPALDGWGDDSYSRLHGFRWDSVFFLPWTLGECGEDSGVACLP